MTGRRTILAGLAFAPVLGRTARAEVTEVVFAREYGLQFLPTIVMERHGLVEKHAQANGIPGLKVRWSSFGGPSVINDGMISGAIHFGTFGSVPLITLWSRTRNGVGVAGVAPMATFPVYLNTRDPAVRSVKDFSDRNRIAVPAVKISAQALLLEMAAIETWGEAAFTRLDPLTVSMSHPDAVVAMSTDKGAVDSHFVSPPFHEQEMRFPGVHTVTTNTDILGGPATAVVLASTRRFRDVNPVVFRSVRQALLEAVDTINANKRAAAGLYLEATGDKRSTEDEITAIISDPGYVFTTKPQKFERTAAFMAQIKLIHAAPTSWKDLFFPEMAEMTGD